MAFSQSHGGHFLDCKGMRSERVKSVIVIALQVPLDSLDLSHVSILYTQGEMAAITPIYVSSSNNSDEAVYR